MMSDQNHYHQTIKIAVVGDIHDQWEAADGIALKHLGVDLVLFVGDFGNESVEVVRSIASLDIPKAAIFGNHDAWYTATDWGRKRCPYDRHQENRVQQQIDILGPIQVGFSKLDFPHLNLSVVGSRPFSWGGPEWKYGDFYREYYQVNSFTESTERIIEAVQKTAYETIIFIGHNGPTGLGDRPEDPCGKDWNPIGGDFGDPDFAAAIDQTRLLGKSIPLVTFGHMHHHLRHTKTEVRKAVHVSPEETVYVNAAQVPRIIEIEENTHNGISPVISRQRNFSVVSLVGGKVAEVALVWVDCDRALTSEKILYRKSRTFLQIA